MDKINTKQSLMPPAWIITIAAVLFAFWLIAQLREIVVLLVVGYSIAYVLDPLLDRFERNNVSRGTGILLILIVLILALVLLLFTAIPTLIEEYALLSSNLPEYLGVVRDRFEGLLEWLKSVLPHAVALKVDKISFTDVIPSLDSGTINGILKGILSTLLQGYSLTMTIFNIALLPFIVYYIAVDFSNIYNGFLSMFPRDRRHNIEALLSEINSIVSAFVRGQALVALILFVLYLAGLSIVGVKLFLLLAVVAGFGNLIPYVGTISGLTLSTIMALVTFGDFHHVLYVWIVFGVVQIIEGFVVTPWVVGSKTGFSPLIIILALFAGGTMFGLLGVFLAIPIAAVLKVLLGHLHRMLLRRLEAEAEEAITPDTPA